MPFRLNLIIATAVAFGSVTIQAQLPHAQLSTIYPPGVKIGTTVDVTVTGADLEEIDKMFFSHPGISAKPHKDANKFTVTVAANVPPGFHTAWVAGRYGASNPRAFAVDTFEELLSAADNFSLEKAQPVKLNTVVNGKSDVEKIDHYKVVLKKGQRVLVRCLDREIDSRLSGAVIIVDATGRELLRRRMSGFAVFTAPADGDYVIKVHDLVYRGGTEYYYRLVISDRPQIDFVLPMAGVPGSKGKFTLYGRNLPGGKVVPDQTIRGSTIEMKEVEITVPANSTDLPSGIPFENLQASIDGFGYSVEGGNLAFIGYSTAPTVVEVDGNDTPEKAQPVKLPCEISGQFYPRAIVIILLSTRRRASRGGWRLFPIAWDCQPTPW